MDHCSEVNYGETGCTWGAYPVDRRPGNRDRLLQRFHLSCTAISRKSLGKNGVGRLQKNRACSSQEQRWSRAGSNRRPSGCKPDAPTTETAVSIPRTPTSETNSISAGTNDPIVPSEYPIPDDLRAIVEAWPTLAQPVRAGIVAMVKAASRATEKGI